jgi:hypothetical protein
MNTQTLYEFCRAVAAAGSFDALTDDQKALLLTIEASLPKSASEIMAAARVPNMLAGRPYTLKEAPQFIPFRGVK